MIALGKRYKKLRLYVTETIPILLAKKHLSDWHFVNTESLKIDFLTWFVSCVYQPLSAKCHSVKLLLNKRCRRWESYYSFTTVTYISSISCCCFKHASLVWQQLQHHDFLKISRISIVTIPDWHQTVSITFTIPWQYWSHIGNDIWGIGDTKWYLSIAGLNPICSKSNTY